MVPREGVVLDIGCGSGVALRRIEKDAVRTIGIDISRNAIAYAKSRGNANSMYLVGSAESLPIASESIDTVVCGDIIEHLEHPDKLAAEIYRVLKYGGTLVLTTPNNGIVWKMYEFFWDVFGRGRMYRKTHLWAFTRRSICQLFPGMECRVMTLFCIAPICAVIGPQRFLDWGVRIDKRWLEPRNLGTLLFMNATKVNHGKEET